jgi:hypothetical protein
MSLWKVIAAAAVGTMIEWYDFYIFGSLAAIISPLFYPKGNDTLALIAYLSTFAVGFVVRPFGALVFGRIGDLVGRKYAFLVTLVIRGAATAAVGFLPTYASIGMAAPIALLVIRVLQGLALGGEYEFDLDVLVCERPSRWRHRSNESEFNGFVEYRFDPENGGTRVTMTIEAKPVGLYGWLALPLLKLRREPPYLQQLPQLKRAMESPA